jgi:hypothetical protein
VIAKDFLAKEMRRYVESQSDSPVETFYQSHGPHGRHDAKEIGSRNDDIGRVEVYRDTPVDEVSGLLGHESLLLLTIPARPFAFQFFPTLAAKYGYSVLASTAKSVAEYLFGGKIFPVPEPPKFTDPPQVRVHARGPQRP